MDIAHVLSRAPVIPVIQLEDVAKAVPLARALVAGGLPVIEVTLRTRTALQVIETMAREVPDALVGAGTIVRGRDLVSARDAGARFAVSPGATAALLDSALGAGLPFLPGAVTASEIQLAGEAGFTELKFFPAEAAGGVRMLSALAGPFPRVRFCPTGGISPDNYRYYLALDNVLCVGGSWLTPRSAVDANDWAEIERLAAQVTRPRPAGEHRGVDTPLSDAGEEDPGSAAEELAHRR